MGAAWAVNVVRKEGFRSLQHVTYRFSPLFRKSCLGKVPFVVGSGLLPRPDGRERSTGCPVSLRTWDAGWGAEGLSDVLGAGPSTGVFTASWEDRGWVHGACPGRGHTVCRPPLGPRYLLHALEGWAGQHSAPLSGAPATPHPSIPAHPPCSHRPA